MYTAAALKGLNLGVHRSIAYERRSGAKVTNIPLQSYTYLGATTQCRQDRGSNALVAANVDYPQIVKVDYQKQQVGRQIVD